jgi:branched-chain amino acid transport system ATP-binding protein
VSSPLLSGERISVAYGKVEAVREVSLTVPAGTIVTVIGANGAGKTTLLNAIMGLVPSKGAVLFEGRNVTASNVEDRVASGLVLVPERRELFGSLTVEDNLKLGSFCHRGRGDLGAQLDAVYGRFSRLRERARQLAGTLSGGERQMLALGRALMSRPRLLMLDEPSLGLAPQIVRESFRIIAELRASGVSILLIEQNARAAFAVADYGYVMEHGAIALHGSAEELTHNPKVAEIYLGLGGAGDQSARH